MAQLAVDEIESPKWRSLARASTRPPPSQRCSMRPRRVTRSASAASSSSTSEEIVCATASSSASSPPGLADVLFRELLVLVLEHVPAESLLALCETSREFGVLAREVGAARMKHAPRWAARALYGTVTRCTSSPSPSGRSRSATRGPTRTPRSATARSTAAAASSAAASSPARRCSPPRSARPNAQPLALAPSPRSPAPPPAAAARRPDAAGGRGGGVRRDARRPELLSHGIRMRAAATLAAARRAPPPPRQGLADTPGFPRLHGRLFGTRVPRARPPRPLQECPSTGRGRPPNTPGRPALPPRRSGSCAPRRPAPPLSARWWMRCSGGDQRSRRGRVPSRKWRGGTKRSERCCRLSHSR